jgi:hypothetical protein
MASEAISKRHAAMPSLPKAVLEAKTWLPEAVWSDWKRSEAMPSLPVAMTTPCFFARHQPVVYVIEAQLSESPRPQHPALCRCYRLRTFWQPWEPY